MIIGNIVGGATGSPDYYKIVVDDNATLLAIASNGEETNLTATVNDVRMGKTFASADGVITGSKNIPSYQTISGTRLIAPGDDFILNLSVNDMYDYTKLQCIVVKYNTKTSNSFASSMVVINNAVYEVNSIEKMSDVEKDNINKIIKLNQTNNTQERYIIRYFTYREED